MPGTYRYQVQAIDGAGRLSSRSAIVEVTVLADGVPIAQHGSDTRPPSVPTGLATVSLGDREVKISWRPSSDDSPYDVIYVLLRGRTAVARLADTVFVDRPPRAGEYKYRVIAVDGYGNLSLSGRVVGVAAE